MYHVFIRRMQGPLARSKDVYKKLFGKYLVITNTVSYVTLYGLGDGFIQLMERHTRGKQGGEHDFKRTMSVMIFASVNGPVNHVWYTCLDKFIKGAKHATVFKKLAADQLLFAPYSAVAFFMGKTIRFSRFMFIYKL